jgi:WD40 repeat protein
MVAVHPNGKTAAGAGNDGKVRVWDLTTGKVANTFAKGGGLYTVAFDADGSRLAAGSSDCTVRVWDTSTGALLREIATNPNLRPSQALFSPDGKEIVVSCWQGHNQPQRAPEVAAYVIDDPAAKPRLFPAHPASVMQLAFLPDGKTLVAAGGEANGVGSLRVYDFATAKPLGQFTGHKHWGQNLAVSPDGKMVASTGWASPTSGELRLWDPRGFRPVATVAPPGEKEYISAGAISPDGRLLVLGGWGKTLAAWDMTDPARPVLKRQLDGHTGGLRSVAFDADGKRFVTSDEAGFVKVWDAKTLAPKASFKASGQGVYRAKFTPDGTAIVTVSGNWQARTRGEIRVWSADGKELGRFPDQNREVWDFVFLDGGKRMVTSQAIAGNPDDAHLKVWDFATKRVLATPVPNGSLSAARSLAVSADGKYLAVGTGVGPVKVFDTSSWQEVLALADMVNVAFRVEFAPDGSALAVASGDNAAIVIRLPWAR